MEKKKRKLNVVDVLVILAVIAAVTLIAVRYFTRPETGVIAMDVIEFTVNVPAIDRSIADFTVENLDPSSPSQMIAAGSYVRGWADSAEAHPITVTEAETVLGGLVTHYEPDKEFSSLTIYCRAEIPSADITTSLGTQELRIGRNFIVKTMDIEVTGIVDTFKRTHK
jgi:hypothetical protein